MTATFALVGGGFRAEAFLRVAAALPERLRVSVAVVRNGERRERLSEKWGIRTVSTLDEIGSGERPDFIVAAVSPNASTGVVRTLTADGHAVLTETPAAPDIAGLLELTRLSAAGARIQVAEQYHREPLLSAQLAVARTGMLGDVSEAQVAVAHDYHGVSVLRRMLGIGFENARITGREFTETLQEGPSRYGDPTGEQTVVGTRTTAWFEFDGGTHGCYDFDDQQYRSWIRSPSVLVRGSRGELRDDTVRFLSDAATPHVAHIERIAAGGPGNHEGMFLRGYDLAGSRLYANPFLPARIAEDELAIAEVLVRMAEYAAGGASVYSVAEAAQDQYLQLAMHRAVASGEPVRTETQEWAKAG